MATTVFKVRPEEGRESIVDDGTEDLLVQGELARAGLSAPGLKFVVSRRFNGRYQRRSDFLWSFVADVLIYRSHVRQAMADLLEVDCTFADIVTSDGTKLIMSSVKVLDALDMSRCAFTYWDDEETRRREAIIPIFREEVLEGHSLFMLPSPLMSYQYATEVFVNRYNELGYHGLRFEPVPVYLGD